MWSSDTIGRRRSGSIFDSGKCLLPLPEPMLSTLVISEFFWHYMEGNYTGYNPDFICDVFTNYSITGAQIVTSSLRGKWINYDFLYLIYIIKHFPTMCFYCFGLNLFQEAHYGPTDDSRRIHMNHLGIYTTWLTIAALVLKYTPTTWYAIGVENINKI